MEIREVTDNIAIYSDGQRLQVIHNLGDEFILDFDFQTEEAINIDDLTTHVVGDIMPVFKVSGYCSRSGEDMYRLKLAIRKFEIFEQYLNDYQADLLDWWQNPGGEEKL